MTNVKSILGFMTKYLKVKHFGRKSFKSRLFNATLLNLVSHICICQVTLLFLKIKLTLLPLKYLNFFMN